MSHNFYNKLIAIKQYSITHKYYWARLDLVSGMELWYHTVSSNKFHNNGSGHFDSINRFILQNIFFL